jgi:hypothetical protein
MAKFLQLDGTGSITEANATVVSTGAPSAGANVALDSNGKLDASTMPNGIGANTVSYTASEAIAAGSLVNITSTGVRNADASGGQAKAAHGYVLAAVANGATATVYTDNGTAITGLSGLTQGQTYFLGAVGAVTATRPTTAGNICQVVGVALSATSLKFDPRAAVTLV